MASICLFFVLFNSNYTEKLSNSTEFEIGSSEWKTSTLTTSPPKVKSKIDKRKVIWLKMSAYSAVGCIVFYEKQGLNTRKIRYCTYMN